MFNLRESEGREPASWPPARCRFGREVTGNKDVGASPCLFSYIQNTQHRLESMKQSPTSGSSRRSQIISLKEAWGRSPGVGSSPPSSRANFHKHLSAHKQHNSHIIEGLMLIDANGGNTVWPGQTEMNITSFMFSRHLERSFVSKNHCQFLFFF